MQNTCNKKLIIFGINDFAELVYNYIVKDIPDIDIAAFTVNSKYMPSSKKYNDIDVVPFEDIEKIYQSNEYKILVCVGYKNMNINRKELFEGVKNKGYEIADFIHSDAKVYSNNIGIGNIILPEVIIEPFVEIGCGNIFYTKCLISHHTKIGNFNFFAVDCCVAGHVSIENNSFLGANSTIRNGINIGSYSLIGASAYVNKNVNEYNAVMPAKSIISSKKSTDFEI